MISGSPDVIEITQAWADIKLQYAEALGSSNEKAYRKTFIGYLQSQFDYDECMFLIEMLSSIYTVQFARELDRCLKRKLELDPSDRDAYFKKLDKAFFIAKDYKIKLAEHKGRLAKMVESDAEKKGSGKVDEEYFIVMLAELSDHAKFRITDEITTLEYCHRVKALIKYTKEVQKHLNKPKNGK